MQDSNDFTLKIHKPNKRTEICAVQRAVRIVDPEDGPRVEFYRAGDPDFPAYQFRLRYQNRIPDDGCVGLYLENTEGRLVQRWVPEVEDPTT